MLHEALTALHGVLDVIDVRGYNHLSTGAKPSKLITPATPKTIEQLEIPKITLEMYDMRSDPGRRLQCQIDIESNQYVDNDESYDTDSTSYIPAVDAPEPWLLFFQIELLSARHHDEITLIEQIAELIGDAKDIDVSYTIAGHTITWPCHLHLVDTQHMSDGKGNEFEGRAIFSYSFEAWKWPTAEPVNVPLIEQRVIRIGAPGTDPDDEEIIETKNLDS